MTYRSSSSTYELDSSDRYLLSELSKNSRVSATALSAGLRASKDCSPLSVDTVINRIKKFEKDGIITGYGVLLNPEAISQLGFKVLLFLNALPNEKLEAIIRTCQLDSRVIHIIKTMGEWDLEIDLEISDFRECRSTAIELTRKFPRIVRDCFP